MDMQLAEVRAKLEAGKEGGARRTKEAVPGPTAPVPPVPQ
jgi:hypothetical protein